MIHLDTSFLIRALAHGSPQDRRLRDFLRRGEPLAMSAVAWAEFLCGPVSAGHIQAVSRLVPERPAFDEGDALLAARLFNESGRRRGSLADCMIAAAALRAGAPLATANAADFRRFDAAGLRLVAD